MAAHAVEPAVRRQSWPGGPGWVGEALGVLVPELGALALRRRDRGIGEALWCVVVRFETAMDRLSAV